MTHAERRELLGLGFDPMKMEEAIERCLRWCEEEESPRTIITANAAVLCMMRRDEALASACKAGDLVLADGMSVVWAHRFAGTPVPERVTGVDLMGGLLEKGAERGLRVYFLGARREVLDELIRRCRRRHPGLVIVGSRDGYFAEEESDAIVDAIRAAKPQLLLIGMPTPFKETWSERNRERLGVPVIMGVGGSFDVHAGFIKRAPKIFQRMGLEWFWRLLMEPRKMWKRYLQTNLEFIWGAGREILARRLGFQRSQISSSPNS